MVSTNYLACCISVVLGAILSSRLSVNYLIKSHHYISGDAIITVMLIRNPRSFAINCRQATPDSY